LNFYLFEKWQTFADKTNESFKKTVFFCEIYDIANFSLREKLTQLLQISSFIVKNINK